MEEDGKHKHKSRICTHGNRDIIKDDMRKDSPTAPFNVTRMMLALTAFFPLKMGVVEIIGSYMQSGPIKR